MEQYQDDNWIRTQELLQHSREFIAYFELAEAKMDEWRQEIERHALRLQQQQESISLLTDKSLAQINQHRDQLIQHLHKQLSPYAPDQFQRIAHESCELVKQSANDAVNKSNKLLHSFQLRFNFFAVLITILTAFIVVLYLNGELPWEMHHVAKNERQAGRMLLQVWPKLSQEEKTKILTYINHS
jgi:hypothetical protein